MVNLNNVGSVATISDVKDTERLLSIGESMNAYMRSQNGLGISEGTSFGKVAWHSPTKEAVKSAINFLGNTAFKNERLAAGESAGLATDVAISNKFRLEVAEGIKKEYVARAENSLLATQSSTGVLNNITTHQQFYLVALVQGVVQSSYNKIFKTVVDARPIFQRPISYPILLDHNGKSHNLANVINDNKKILELTSGSTAAVVYSIPFTNKEINVNVIDEYNASVGTGQQIAGPRNYINRGFKITSVDYDFGAAGGVKNIPCNFVSSENHAQSGEISNSVGVVQLTLSPEDGAPAGSTPIQVFGRVYVDGTVNLTSTDAKVKKIYMSFFLPPVGTQNPFNVAYINGKFQENINQTAQANMSLNEQLLDDNTFYTGKDSLELFNTQVITITNARKDAYALKVVDETIEELDRPSNGYRDTLNYFDDPSRKLLVKEKLDMSAADAGYTDSITGNNLLLANKLFKVCNELERKMNPTERRFTMYSPSVGAQWLKDPYGANVTKFNIVGSVEDGIAGLTTPYDIIRCTVGGLYEANYVTTNRLVPVKETINGPIGKIPAGKKAIVDTMDYTIIPNFEETKDTFLFVSGKEYLREGTGSSEDPYSASLLYAHRFDVLRMNKVVGRVAFSELPTSII